MLIRALEAVVARPIDALLPFRRELAREKAELEGLRSEHRDLARSVAREAGRTREAISAATIIVAADEIDRMFTDQAPRRRAGRGKDRR